jgi:ankyrin repeat protein
MNSLLKAIGKGASIEIIKEIAHLNPILNHRYENNQLTPLMLAAKYGREDLIEFLIAEGCSVNRVDKTGRTALSLASNHGHYDVVSLLLSSGADINHQDNAGATPLMICSQSGRIRLVELFLKSGADKEVILFLSTFFKTKLIFVMMFINRLNTLINLTLIW